MLVERELNFDEVEVMMLPGMQVEYTPGYNDDSDRFDSSHIKGVVHQTHGDQALVEMQTRNGKMSTWVKLIDCTPC